MIRRASEILRKDIRETQCLEQKLQRLTKLIKTPLDELGGADAPKAVEEMGDVSMNVLPLWTGGRKGVFWFVHGVA